jgi:hypothetical protein
MALFPEVAGRLDFTDLSLSCAPRPLLWDFLEASFFKSDICDSYWFTEFPLLITYAGDFYFLSREFLEPTDPTLTSLYSYFLLGLGSREFDAALV